MRTLKHGSLAALIVGQLINIGCTSEMGFKSTDYLENGGAHTLPSKNPPGAITVPTGAVTLPTQPKLTAKFEPLSSGAHYVCYNKGGKVKCWGSNIDGELGYGFASPSIGENHQEMGRQLPYLNFGPGRSAIQLSGGHFTNCAVLDDGSLMCWGLNTVGYLGLGDTAKRSIPTKVDLGTGRKAIQVAAAGYNTCVLLDNGQVKCWGSNGSGSLGYEHRRNIGMKPGEMGDNLPAIDLGKGRTAKKIAGHSDTKCAILDNDTVKCWGPNSGGVLGTGDTISRGSNPGEMGDNLPVVNLGTGRKVVDIDVAAHACAILDNGSVKCWGFNWRQGSLGLGDTVHHGDEPGEMGDALPTVDLGTGRTAKKIVVGFYGNCALLDNNSIKCWGANFTGGIGQEDMLSRGSNPGEMGDNLPAINLGSGRTVKNLTVSLGHTVCALLDNDTIKCWGQNYAGQLGLGIPFENLETLGGNPGEMGDNLPTVDVGM